jgi:hypothetical protein
MTEILDYLKISVDDLKNMVIYSRSNIHFKSFIGIDDYYFSIVKLLLYVFLLL